MAPPSGEFSGGISENCMAIVFWGRVKAVRGTREKREGVEKRKKDEMEGEEKEKKVRGRGTRKGKRAHEEAERAGSRKQEVKKREARSGKREARSGMPNAEAGIRKQKAGCGMREAAGNPPATGGILALFSRGFGTGAPAASASVDKKTKIC